MTKTQGTKEWADWNINFQTGCINGCLYCYACRMAIRYKRIASYEQWAYHPKIDLKKANHKYKKRKGRGMFPTSHDITGYNLGYAFDTILRLVKAGNEVLVTTKPRLECIQKLTNAVMKQYRDQIQFRFTITSIDNDTLGIWEPGAPGFEERFKAVQVAYWQGFKTSVSIEPYLDQWPERVITALEGYITESIWLGVMNSSNLPQEGKDIYEAELYEGPMVEKIVKKCLAVAKKKLRLKDSIQNILGVDIYGEPKGR